VRDFFWDEFADWYIEIAKVRVRAGDRSAIPVLVHVLDRCCACCTRSCRSSPRRSGSA
jgi:valyl-tRNA synthetase